MNLRVRDNGHIRSASEGFKGCFASHLSAGTRGKHADTVHCLAAGTACDENFFALQALSGQRLFRVETDFLNACNLCLLLLDSRRHHIDSKSRQAFQILSDNRMAVHRLMHGRS